MSQITVSDLTFCYEGSFDNIFENVSFILDTDWKLGFVGRNGRGKTTFLKLLMGSLEYSGKIVSSVGFEYFPFSVYDPSKPGVEVVEEMCPNYEFWQLCRELSFLDIDEELLFRPFETLSNGEQTKILLAALFLKEDEFLLIDEPTNHLDANAREVVSKYLNSKKGFILVSHDRAFLDSCIDHVLAINKTGIDVQKGNFSSWMRNKEYQDNFEIAENKKLKKDIKRLEKAEKQTKNWSNKVEKTKYGGKNDSGLRPDRGYVGRKAAKMMKRSIAAQNRKEQIIENKSKLLKSIETSEKLKLFPLSHYRSTIVEVSNLTILYGENKACSNINFNIKNGDRIALCGKNGAGKSSILKLILGEEIKFSDFLNIAGALKFSYVSQDMHGLYGSLSDFCSINNIDETLFKAILKKLDFSRVQFDKNIELYSAGQKKKILLAKSLCERAHLYIWDEPLNFIDVLSRIQIENLILEYKPTMLFVEHDKTFSDKISTKTVNL